MTLQIYNITEAMSSVSPIIFNYNPANSKTLSMAAFSPSAFLPPAVAKWGWPPPPPWISLAASFTRLPAFSPPATRLSVIWPRNWKAMFFTVSAGRGAQNLMTLTPLTSCTFFSSLSFSCASFSFMKSSTCFFSPAFSSIYLRMVPARSGALLKSAFKSCSVSSMVFISSSTRAPV